MKLRHTLGNLLLAAGAAAFTLLLLEGALRVLGLGAATEQATLLTRYDSVLGWSKTPGASATNVTSEYRATERINAHGLRGPERSLGKTPGTRRVLLLGDSFLEGYTVEEEALLSTVLEERLAAADPEGHYEVINGGTAGYSTDQELLFFDHIGAGYRPDVTVLLFYVNDVWFNGQDHYWRGAKPYFELAEDGTLSLHNVPVPPPDPDAFAFAVEGGTGLTGAIRRVDGWLGAHSRVYFLLRSSVLQTPIVRGFMIRQGLAEVPGEWAAWSADPGPAVVHAWRLTEALLAELRDHVRAAGSSFVVYYVPSRAAVDDADWQRTRRAYAMDGAEWSPSQDATVLARVCTRQGLDCLIDVDGFRTEQARLAAEGAALYYQRDAHWTDQGHRFAADAIALRVRALLAAAPEAERGAEPSGGARPPSG